MGGSAGAAALGWRGGGMVAESIFPASIFPVVKHGLCAILLIACLCNQALAQTDEGVPDGLEIEIERTVESASEEESSAPDFLDELEHYRHNPINLYTTTADILTRLPGITLPDAVAILTAVDSLNPVEFEQFEEELPALLSAQQWLMLRTYTTLARPMSELDHPGLPLQVDIRSSWFRDLQPRRGYGDDLFRRVTRRDPATGDSLAVDTISLGPSYLGPRDALLTRLNLKYGDNELNLTFEKDAGEPFMFSDTVARSYANYELVDPAQPAGSVEQKLGTFISGSGAATVGPVRLIVGDFTAEYGQGLALWSSFGGAKNGAVIDAPFKAGRGITPYRSSGEVAFFRGGAVSFNESGRARKGFSGSVFGSYRSFDALFGQPGFGQFPNAGGDTLAEEVTSIRTDGYHRTRTELRRSGGLDERVVGASARYGFEQGHVGITGYDARYSVAIQPDLPYDFSGQNFQLFSLDGRYLFGDFYLFGEAAHGANGNIGMIAGIGGTIDNAAIVIAGRNVDPGFYTPHGIGFGESARQQQNERGIYIGVKVPVIPQGIFSAYFDLYRFPQRSYSIPFPISGADGMLQFDWSLSPRFSLSCRFQQEVKGDATTPSDAPGRAPRALFDKTTASGRIEAGYASVGGRVQLRARFERKYVGYTTLRPAANGVLTFLDLRWRPTTRLSFGGRIALFNADNFDVALREFEQDVAGKFSNLALYGQGQRVYLFAQWSPTVWGTIAAKYGETWYRDRTVISEGSLQEINGQLSSSIAVQIDVRF